MIKRNRQSNITTVLMFVLLTLLTGGLMVEHSKLAVITLIIVAFYGISLLRKYGKGEL